MKSFRAYYKKVTRYILDKLYLFLGLKLNIEIFGIKKYLGFKRELKCFKLQSAQSEDMFPVTKLWPIYSDRADSAGRVSQYFYQDLFVAQRIFINNPLIHADVGSRIDGFVAHVASFRQIEVYDVRPLKSIIPNVSFRQMDLMNVEAVKEESVDSISCLHVLEHFGLGRYGDPICFNGHSVGLKSLTKMLKKGGTLYLSVPFGTQRIEFHAHRVFSLDYLLQLLNVHYSIVQFSYIDDSCNFFPNVEITPALSARNFGCHFGCAIFELRKK